MKYSSKFKNEINKYIYFFNLKFYQVTTAITVSMSYKKYLINMVYYRITVYILGNFLRKIDKKEVE
jgi:hypothetical protein